MERYLTDRNLVSKFENVYFHRYATPVRAGSATHYVLGWKDEFLAKDKLEKLLSGFYGNVSGSPRRYVDNTAEFARWLAKREANPTNK